jgi:uncharacterized protein with HEPN domain
MSQRDDRVSIMQMLDFALEAVAMASSRTRVDLDRNRMFYLAIQHLIQNAGEAARRVSADTRVDCPGIRWAGVAGVRSQIALGYDNINLDTVWDALVTDLPPPDLRIAPQPGAPAFAHQATLAPRSALPS